MRLSYAEKIAEYRAGLREKAEFAQKRQRACKKEGYHNGRRIWQGVERGLRKAYQMAELLT